MSESVCKQCGKPLTHDEQAIHRKLLDRTARECLCADCLSRHFQVDVKLIYQKIDECKRRGCTLF